MNFRDYPNTSTPLSSQSFNKSLGDVIVDKIESKNMIDIYQYSLGYINSSGVNTFNDLNCRGNNYIEVKPNTKYTISTNASIFAFRLNEYASDFTHIKQTTKTSAQTLTITTSSTTKYLRWSLNYDSTTVITFEILESLKLQLEMGELRSDYVKYKNFDNTQKILWTNPNPSSEFVGGNITLSSDDYDELLFLFKNTDISSYEYQLLARKGKNASMIGFALSVASKTIGFYAGRNISYINAKTLNISDCVVASSQSAFDNTKLIPLRVIGYKTGMFD